MLTARREKLPKMATLLVKRLDRNDAVTILQFQSFLLAHPFLNSSIDITVDEIFGPIGDTLGEIIFRLSGLKCFFTAIKDPNILRSRFFTLNC